MAQCFVRAFGAFRFVSTLIVGFMCSLAQGSYLKGVISCCTFLKDDELLKARSSVFGEFPTHNPTT